MYRGVVMVHFQDHASYFHIARRNVGGVINNIHFLQFVFKHKAMSYKTFDKLFVENACFCGCICMTRCFWF